jgi:phosphatidate cytidylyltransferase
MMSELKQRKKSTVAATRKSNTLGGLSTCDESLNSQGAASKKLAATDRLFFPSNGSGSLSETPVKQQSAGMMTGEQVNREESKSKRILMRVFFGACMFSVFCGSVYMGHVYICTLVAIIEMLLFRELVRVRYSAFFATIEDTIPLFRTTQWMWFVVACFYTYGDFFLDAIQNNQELHYLLPYMQYMSSVSFLLYSGTFVLTITTLQREHIKFQINQLCWTILVLCLTFGQLKYIMHNIFNGLFWYVFPCCLVFTNDIMAYVSGMTWGRKFINRPFIRFSPGKTWEGFIGGWIFTMVIAWYLSGFLAKFTWMTCPTNEFRLAPVSLECELDPVFQIAQSFIPAQIFDILPRYFVKIIPSVVEICSKKGNPDALTRCISGEETHVHHHFELVFKNYFPVQVHALWLAMFASLVAPFGGFLASAIKRAYGVKDFDSIIPGHGGVMDRMDCQFLMALCTWVHYNTFVKLATVSVPRLTYMYSLLSEQEKKEFLQSISVQGRNKIKSLVDFGF